MGRSTHFYPPIFGSLDDDGKAMAITYDVAVDYLKPLRRLDVVDASNPN